MYMYVIVLCVTYDMLLNGICLNRFGGYLISVEILQAGDMLAVFYAILVGSLSLGQATPSIESVVNATGAAGEIFEIIDRVS